MNVLPFSLITAFRFSRGKKKGEMVSLISIFSTLGIALGVAVLIIGLSAMNGFERELNNRVLAVVPHGEILFIEPPKLSIETIEQRILSTDGVVATSPFILLTGLIENGTDIQAIQIKGVDPSKEHLISALPEFIDASGWEQMSKGTDKVILGAGIAKKINASVGSMVSVVIPNLSADNKLQQPKRIRLQVVGLITLGGTVDQNLALINLSDAKKYQTGETELTGVGIKIVDPFRASEIIKSAAYQIREPLKYDTWIRQYGFMHDDIQMIRGIMYFAMVLVMAVACFNIVSTLVVAVKEKSKDIAILRTLGATDNYILSIFVWYGLLSALLGTLIGVLGGVLASIYLTSLIKIVENLFGIQFLSADIYFVDFLPSELQFLDVLIVFITSIILSLFASIYPARRAINLEPARILSGM